jgi:hypothetical protein
MDTQVHGNESSAWVGGKAQHRKVFHAQADAIDNAKAFGQLIFHGKYGFRADAGNAYASGVALGRPVSLTRAYSR